MLRLLALLAVVAAGAASDGATVSADLTVFGTGTVPCTHRVHAAVMAAVPDALPGILVVGIRLMDPRVTVPQPVSAAALPALHPAAASPAVHAPAPAPQLGALYAQELRSLYGGAKAGGRALVQGCLSGVAPAARAGLCNWSDVAARLGVQGRRQRRTGAVGWRRRRRCRAKASWPCCPA